jgi:hypothetical protein
MSRRKKRKHKKQRKAAVAVKFARGEKIRVKPGTPSPEYPDIPLGGWVGVIAGRVSGTPPHYVIAWSEETLANVHPVYLRRCERDFLPPEEAELEEAVLEPDPGGPLAIEQPTSLVTRPLSPDDAEDRVRAVFGLTSDDPVPAVNLESQRKYHAYLAAHLPFPFEAKRMDDYGEPSSEVTVTGLSGELPPDGVSSIVCEALEDGRPVQCPLLDLLVEDDQVGGLLEDYEYWLHEFVEDQLTDDEESDSEYADEEPDDDFVPDDEDDDFVSDEGDDLVSDDEDEGYAPPPVLRALPVKKAGRNDPCPCGSGKKYKKCCWNKDRQAEPGGEGEAKSFTELLKGAIAETFQQPRRRREVRAAVSDTAYQIKITLARTDPPIWRRVELPDCTLETLHDVIQTAMGWEDDHLHVFRTGEGEFSDPRVTRDSFDRVRAERSMTLSRLVEQGCRKFSYEYDFGDSWEHDIKIEKTLPEGTRREHPVCVAGEKACPPEDCGGVWGYYEILEALQNRDDPDRAERLEWLGDYDPEEFDVAAVNRRLIHIRPR